MPEEAQKYLQRVESAALSVGQLVDALLNLARVRRQGLPYRPPIWVRSLKTS